MSISLIVAFAGVLLALAGTVAMAMRCARLPRTDLIAWTCAMFGLAVALVAQAAGFAAGFSSTTFRAVQIGALVIATLGLALGIAEVAARSLPVRFAARLAVSALGVVGLVILATDPLGSAVFSKAFPAAWVYYQPISASLLTYVLAPFTALVALIAITLTAGRSRHDPAWRATWPAVAAASIAALALALPGLAALAGSTVGIRVSRAFPLLCVLAVALTWLAVSRVQRIRLDVVHQGSRPSWDDDETGGYDPLNEAGGGGRYAAVGEYGPYPGDPGYDDADIDQSGYRQYADDMGNGGGLAAGAGYGPDDEASNAGLAGQPGMPPGGPPPGMPPGTLQPGHPGLPPGQPGLPAAEDHEAWARLFGQIEIYTLLEDRVDAFDGLTEEVVDLVRTHEPDTLVYIVHAVPSAPMQRILYEVYRDREAYEEHKLQPYIAKFEVDRRPYVLATNVIELGLQRAKVSAIPSISDLLSVPGEERADAAAPEAPGAPLGTGVRGGAVPGHAGGPGGGGGPAGRGQGPQRLP